MLTLTSRRENSPLRANNAGNMTKSNFSEMQNIFGPWKQITNSMIKPQLKTF